MKSNVDLTIDRDFQNHNTFSIRDFGKKFPWTTKEAELVDQLSYENNVFVGNAEQRKRKRDFLGMENGLNCERCGRLISIMPWKRKDFLCKPCDDIMENENVELWPGYIPKSNRFKRKDFIDISALDEL